MGLSFFFWDIWILPTLLIFMKSYLQIKLLYSYLVSRWNLFIYVHNRYYHYYYWNSFHQIKHHPFINYQKPPPIKKPLPIKMHPIKQLGFYYISKYSTNQKKNKKSKYYEINELSMFLLYPYKGLWKRKNLLNSTAT